MQSNENKEPTDFEPYLLNPNNKWITKKVINAILSKYEIKHKIKDLTLFRRAMVHESYLKIGIQKPKMARLYSGSDRGVSPITEKEKKKTIPLQENSYERLEFLGDSIIHKVLAKYLFHRYPNESEGFLTRLRAKLENKKALAELAVVIGLDKWILMARSIDKDGGRYNRLSILEDSFEAFVGAMSLEFGDKDDKLCKKFLIRLYEEEKDISYILSHDNNYKDILLRYYHRQKWPDPTYKQIDTGESDGRREFLMYVTNKDGHRFAVGNGLSKKEATQEAAMRALIKLGEIDDPDESDESASDSESEDETESDDDSDDKSDDESDDEN